MAGKRPSRRAQVAAGLLAVLGGLGVVALAAGHLATPTGRLDPFGGLIAGLVLVFVGAILVLPERNKSLKAWFGALMITSMALLLDWVAFGPGERRVTAGLSNANPSVRMHFWEAPGRVLLLSGAALLNLMALWAWVRASRRKPSRA